MSKPYKEIKAHITKQYQDHYLKQHTSHDLAESIKNLTMDDVIAILEEMRDTPELSQTSLSLSRRSDLFDKLILMKADKPQGWVLRLHTYNMLKQCDEPGYVISNLNRKIRDDENHIHEHSWQLASKFLLGGFKNHQYTKTEEGPIFNRYNLVSTLKDNVSKENASRKATLEGQTGIIEISEDLYQQGDLVHYPIEIPHKIDTAASSYLGMTITLALTSERYTEDSIFYEKIPNDLSSDQIKELAIEAHPYTKETHLEAINSAITLLKLIKLCDQLAENGFERFNRFVDPITNQSSANNILETELLPTIAMIMLQKDNDYIEHPMTSELQGRSANEIQTLNNTYAKSSDDLKKLIEHSIGEMHQPSLMQLIHTSQQNLIDNLYTASCSHLTPDALQVVQKREKMVPAHVLSSSGLFSNKQESESNKEFTGTVSIKF